MALAVPRHVGSLDQGSNPYPVHCQVDSLPLNYQGSPTVKFKMEHKLIIYLHNHSGYNKVLRTPPPNSDTHIFPGCHHSLFAKGRIDCYSQRYSFQVFNIIYIILKYFI